MKKNQKLIKRSFWKMNVLELKSDEINFIF